jgi:hypothetical protein
MRSIVLLTLLAGCATGTAVEGSNTVTPRQTIFTSEQGTLVSDPARAEATEVDAPPLAVWAAVKKVYSDLGIPVTVDNPAGHQLGNSSFVKTRQVGSESMPTLVNCGNGMTGPNAASFRMTLSLMTDVNPDGKGGSKLQTTFVANGQDVTGGSSYQIPCGTTGRLELLILTRVKTALGKS